MPCLLLITACAMLQVSPVGVDLQGIVTDEAGNPVSGARVDITTAAPRVGEGIFCLSCYGDLCEVYPRGWRGTFHT
jgi:hypothetical protein